MTPRNKIAILLLSALITFQILLSLPAPYFTLTQCCLYLYTIHFMCPIIHVYKVLSTLFHKNENIFITFFKFYLSISSYHWNRNKQTNNPIHITLSYNHLFISYIPISFGEPHNTGSPFLYSLLNFTRYNLNISITF